MATLFAGTSGFAYSTWKPGFYPAKLPAKGFLKHYAERLNSVEINYTFRRLPARATLASWVEATPAGFVFAVKANQRITHILRLKNAGEATEVFFRAIDPLRSARRLGPVLFQLPPNLKCDVPLLADYLALLPTDIRHAFEFRHASWLAEPVYELLRRHNAALCLAESEKLEIPEAITAEYSPEDLDSIAVRTRQLLATGRDLYLMFKHEDTPDGALNAERLLKAG
jgi:uncharacterized protein YecE (DUF72 family)